jgi:hypothetical protein
MTDAPVEPLTRPTPAAPTSSTFADGGQAAVAGLRDLMQAYQAMARRNGEKLTASIQALSAVKTPAEFIELQRKLMTESVAAAVSDSAAIGKLTTAAFTAAFEPMRKQVEMLKGGSKS